MTVDERFERINATLDRVDDDLEILARHVVKNEARFAELTEKIHALTDFSRETGERLNIVIGIVERYFSNGGKK